MITEALDSLTAIRADLSFVVLVLPLVGHDSPLIDISSGMSRVGSGSEEVRYLARGKDSIW